MANSFASIIVEKSNTTERTQKKQMWTNSQSIQTAAYINFVELVQVRYWPRDAEVSQILDWYNIKLCLPCHTTQS